MSADTSSLLPAEDVSQAPALSIDIELNQHSLGDAADWTALAELSARRALAMSGGYHGQAAEIYVEIVSNDRSQELNREYRGKDKPTNVLSFPGVEPDELQDMFAFADQGGPPVPLGDLIVADAVVVAEAAAQKKPIHHHFAHLVVHGVLHLVGYDHIEDDEAEEMEDLERQILASLDIPDPYREEG